MIYIMYISIYLYLNKSRYILYLKKIFFLIVLIILSKNERYLLRYFYELIILLFSFQIS